MENLKERELSGDELAQDSIERRAVLNTVKLSVP
jgi:hypothetical protein